MHCLVSDRHPRLSRSGFAVALLALLALVVPAGALAVPAPKPPVDIQILNVSDWHGESRSAERHRRRAAISSLWKYDRTLRTRTRSR